MLDPREEAVKNKTDLHASELKKYVVVEADLKKHRDEILAVWKRNLSTAHESRYSWIYENNQTSGAASAWMVRAPRGDIVGAAGLLRRNVKVGNQQMMAGQVIDMVVDKRHRTAGPALMLQKAVIDLPNSDSLSFLYGFPNKESETVLARVGYHVLGVFHRWTKPLRSEYKFTDSSLARMPMKWIFLTVDAAMKALSGEFHSRKHDDLRVEVKESFDGRFDSLWVEASRNSHIIGDRSARYLNWRFGSKLREDHRVFCLSRANGTLLAYAICQLIDQRIDIVDFCAADHDAISTLFIELSRYWRAEDVHSISVTYLGAEAVTQRLRRIGFYKRPSREHVLVYSGTRATEQLTHAVLNKDLWHLTVADKDV